MRATSYTSVTDQNELLKVMAHMVLRGICKHVSHFGVIVDGTQDVQGVEQEAICVRYIDDAYNVHEDFLGLYSVSETTGASLSNMLQDALLRLNLPMTHLRAQTYVGQIPGLPGSDQYGTTTSALHALRCTHHAPDLCEDNRECTIPPRCSERGAGSWRLLQFIGQIQESVPRSARHGRQSCPFISVRLAGCHVGLPLGPSSATSRTCCGHLMRHRLHLVAAQQRGLTSSTASCLLRNLYLNSWRLSR